MKPLPITDPKRLGMPTRALVAVAPELRPSRPRSVLCGVEPALASLDAAHQAAEIAGAGRLAFVSVTTHAGRPEDDMYLEAAVFLARRDRGARDVRRLDGGRPLAHVLALASRHDLFVVGASAVAGESNPLVRAAVRRARVPVLVARRLLRADTLGDRVVVVFGDEGGDARAAALAAELARNAGAELAATVIDHGGSPDAVFDAARRAGATLIAVGGLAAPRWRSAGDLAVTVAERAPCSVLVARGRDTPR